MNSGVTTMTKRAAVGEIINGGQATLLELLQAAPGRLTRLELLGRVDMSRTMVNRHLLESVECELVDAVKAGEVDLEGITRRRSALMYSITRAGVRALVRYQRKADEAAKVLVPPATFSTAGQPYVPPHHAYYRNEGNKHILARGVSC